MKPRIATKLTLSFLLIALLPVSGAGYLVYIHTEKRLRDHIDEDLSKISADKARRIEAYFVERRQHGMALARAQLVIDSLERLNHVFRRSTLDSPAYKDIDARIRPYLSYYIEAYRYQNLHLVSEKKDIVFSAVIGGELGLSLKAEPYKDSALAKVIDNANTLLQAENSNFSIDQPTGKPAAFVAAPVFNKGKLIGTVALELSNQELYNLAEDHRTLEKTGEAVIGQRINDKAVIVVPLRHDPNAAFRRRVSLGSPEAHAVQQAVQGKSGRGVVTDYRRKEVLAVWRYLPNARWGLVVKIDSAEVLAPIRQLRKLFLATGSVIVLLVAIMASLAAKWISAPIKKLREAAESITRGDLAGRVAAASHDEIGQLAAAFNQMAARVQDRTEALDRTAKELRFRKENLEFVVEERTRELQNQQERYRSLLENSSDIITILAADGSIRYESPSVERILGYRPDELVGKPALDFVHPEDLSRVASFLQDGLKRSAVALTIELRFRHRDGSWRYLECIGNNQLHNSAVGGIVVNSRDIGDRKIAEQEGADFIAMIAHDLRSPLSNVNGVSALMKDGAFGPVTEEQMKWLDKITQTTQGLADLVNDFLDLSKSEAGRIEKRPEAVNVEKLLAAALDNFRFLARDRDIALHAKTSPALPPIHADPRRLERVLNNLLSNALKFTPQGGEIECGACRSNGEVKIWIRDTGIGIPREEISQLFEKYKQTTSGKTSMHEGTGLGLAICKMIVEAHRGRIWAESEDGKGTTFFFTLPVGAEHAIAQRSKSETS